MVTPQAHPLARFLQHFATTAVALPDAELLERFADRRDGDAFATLVRRHGPMVLAVCRRVLGEGDWHAAEDAFQATFLVLAHKASALRRPQALGPWLHGVAQRTALKARASAARRRVCEQRACAQRPEACPPPDLGGCDLRPILDEALARLPQRYRAPLILCYLEGRTVTQAAVELGWPRGTVATRLARARHRLRRQLTRQGVAISVAGLAAALLEASAAIPAGLARSTGMAAVEFMDDPARATATGSVPAGVAALTGEVLQVMLLSKIGMAALGILAVGLLGLGLAALAYWPTAAAAQTPPATVARPQGEPVPPQQEAAKAKRLKLPKGPLPVQALAIVKDGKLELVQAVTAYQPVTVNDGNGKSVTGYQAVEQYQSVEYNVKDVTAYNTHGEAVDVKMLAKMLAKETLVLVTREFDPLHLRVIKEGMLVLELPAPVGQLVPPAQALTPPGLAIEPPAPKR